MLFFKKKKEPVYFDYSRLVCDMHSHMIPGVDDGAQTIQDSIELLQGFSSLGYKKIITTPHILWGMYNNSAATIGEKWPLLVKAIADNNIPLEVGFGAEYFLDEHFDSLLVNKEPLLTVSGNKILVEFSLNSPSLHMKESIFNALINNYQPIIAHAERYTYLAADKGFYEELRQAGCLFQLNILSTTGHYGKRVQELSQYLLENDFYDLIGTDMHHKRHLDALKHVEMSYELERLIESGRLLNSSL